MHKIRGPLGSLHIKKYQGWLEEDHIKLSQLGDLTTAPSTVEPAASKYYLDVKAGKISKS